MAESLGKPKRPPPPTKLPGASRMGPEQNAHPSSPGTGSVRSDTPSGSQETIKAATIEQGSASSQASPQRDRLPVSRACPEHSFLTSVADVREMEHSLLKLLDDFHAGKLQAFGSESTFEKMDHVREQQESLARIHFEMDSEQEQLGLESEAAKKKAKENLQSLMTHLQDLSVSLQDLQKD